MRLQSYAVVFTEAELAHENTPIRFHYPVKKKKKKQENVECNLLFYFFLATATNSGESGRSRALGVEKYSRIIRDNRQEKIMLLVKDFAQPSLHLITRAHLPAGPSVTRL